MTCMEPAERYSTPHRQWHKLGSSRRSWYQEDSVHASVNQRGSKSEWQEILLLENELKLFTRATIEQWLGRCSLGQWCTILLKSFHNDWWSPGSAIILELWAEFAFGICLLQRCVSVSLMNMNFSNRYSLYQSYQYRFRLSTHRSTAWTWRCGQLWQYWPSTDDLSNCQREFQIILWCARTRSLPQGINIILYYLHTSNYKNR